MTTVECRSEPVTEALVRRKRTAAKAVYVAPVAAATMALTMSANAWAAGLPSSSGGGTTPPGVGANVDTVVAWVAWTVFTIAILGIMFTAVRMMIQHHRGEGGQHFASLLYVLGGALITAAASGVVGALVTAG